MAELSQEKLEELVVGKPAQPRVVFFEKAALDVNASHASGSRVYVTKTYIKKVFPGVTDWVPYEATEQDIREWPEEYEYFMGNRQGRREPSIDIIPGLGMAHLQELVDYGLSTVPRLALAELVPPHLEYARQAARRVMNALTGENDDREIRSEIQAHPEAEAGAGIEGHGTGVEQQRKAEALLEEGGRHDHGDVGRHEPASSPRGGGGETGEGLHPAGRLHYREGVVSPDFDMTVSYR